MSSDPKQTEFEVHSNKANPIAELLETGDGFAHYLVAILLLLLAVGVLLNSTWNFVNEFRTVLGTDRFVDSGLRYLSDLLFGVIVLELLSTILTYIRARSLEATIKDFLIVALISSVRKILLVGAQSSLEKASGDQFVKESFGTILSVLAILLLIGGLIVLERRKVKQ